MRRGRATQPAKPGAASAAPGSRLWLHGLICGAIVTLATPTALLLGVLLAPGLACLTVERAPGRPVTRAVTLCGLAAVVSPLRTLWDQGQTIAGSLALLGDPSTVALAWGAAGAGWLVCELAPLVIATVMEAVGVARATRLRAARARLVEEWGFPAPPDKAAGAVLDEKGPRSGVTG